MFTLNDSKCKILSLIILLHFCQLSLSSFKFVLVGIDFLLNFIRFRSLTILALLNGFVKLLDLGLKNGNFFFLRGKLITLLDNTFAVFFFVRFNCTEIIPSK